MAAHAGKVSCKNCKGLYDPNYLPIHTQACTPTSLPFTPPAPTSKPRKDHHSSHQTQHYSQQSGGYGSYHQVPVYQPMPTYQYPMQSTNQPYYQQAYPQAWTNPTQAFNGNQGKICRYCQAPFYARAQDHLAQCPGATQCRNCGDFCAQGTIRDHLARKCKAARGARN